MAIASDKTVTKTSGEEEIHLRIGNPPLAMRAVTSSRKVTASVSLPQDVYKSSTKLSRLTTAAAVGHSSRLSSVVRLTAKFASQGDDLSPNARQFIS